MKRHPFLTRNEEKALRDLKRRLQASFNVRDIRVYGSKVKGYAEDDSDIDVMVRVGEQTPGLEERIDDIVFEINLRNDLLISTVVFTEDEIERGPMSESPLYKVIQREGVSI